MSDHNLGAWYHILGWLTIRHHYVCQTVSYVIPPPSYVPSSLWICYLLLYVRYCYACKKVKTLWSHTSYRQIIIYTGREYYMHISAVDLPPFIWLCSKYSSPYPSPGPGDLFCHTSLTIIFYRPTRNPHPLTPNPLNLLVLYTSMFLTVPLALLEPM